MTAVAEIVRHETASPSEWIRAELGDLIALEYGKSLSAEVRKPGGVPVYGSNGIVGWHDEPLVPSAGIIIGRKGTAGSVTVSNGPFWPIDTTYYVRPRQSVDSVWLAAILEHAKLHTLNEATGVPGLNRDKAYREPILIPPLNEQRRIAEVLRSVDEVIVASQEALDQSLVVQSSLITDLCFGHGYPMVSLSQILDDIRYGTSAKCAAGEENGQPVLRIPNVVNGRVEADDLKYAVVSDADRRRYSLHPGDIVVVRTNGNPAYIGRSALIAADAEAYLFASYLIRMRFDGNVAWPAYIYAALNSQPVRELLLKAATTSAGNYNINTASLKRITIPLPDPTTQHQISEAIRGATDTVNAGEYEVESLRRMKAMLMSDLLSGHVRVPT